MSPTWRHGSMHVSDRAMGKGVSVARPCGGSSSNRLVGDAVCSGGRAERILVHFRSLPWSSFWFPWTLKPVAWSSRFQGFAPPYLSDLHGRFLLQDTDLSLRRRRGASALEEDPAPPPDRRPPQALERRRSSIPLHLLRKLRSGRGERLIRRSCLEGKRAVRWVVPPGLAVHQGPQRKHLRRGDIWRNRGQPLLGQHPAGTFRFELPFLFRFLIISIMLGLDRCYHASASGVKFAGYYMQVLLSISISLTLQLLVYIIQEHVRSFLIHETNEWRYAWKDQNNKKQYQLEWRL